MTCKSRMKTNLHIAIVRKNILLRSLFTFVPLIFLQAKAKKNVMEITLLDQIVWFCHVLPQDKRSRKCSARYSTLYM